MLTLEKPGKRYIETVLLCSFRIISKLNEENSSIYTHRLLVIITINTVVKPLWSCIFTSLFS